MRRGHDEQDGAKYVFDSRTLVATKFGDLRVGAAVRFTPFETGLARRAEAVRLSSR